MNLVEEFVARYRKEYDFFDQAARLAAQILDGRLRAAGIRSIVTSRAKAIASLEAKVRHRAPQKNYTNTEEIFADIVDLAGVRVALYFPGEVPRVDNTIKTLFIVNETKSFPSALDDSKSRYKKKFSGYFAHHYRVQLKDDVLSDAQQRYKEANLEIQVASVLMHSWAEVEHDLVYKPQQGGVSVEEYTILDELNGIVMAGELALERLQKAGETRVAADGRAFNNLYELASYLLNKLGPVIGSAIGERALGRVDHLFELLTSLKLGTPAQLMPYIESLHANLGERSLVDQIVDQLISKDPSHPFRFDLYKSIQANYRVPGDYLANTHDPDAAVQVEVHRFLQKWITLEQKINEKSKASGGQGVFLSSAALSRFGVTEKPVLAEFDRIRRMRNEIVHGVSVPNLADLQDAGGRIERITKTL